jgi:hypothetical protein
LIFFFNPNIQNLCLTVFVFSYKTEAGSERNRLTNLGLDMFNYNEMKQKVFATAYVPDGYFGKKAFVELAFDAESGKTIAICEVGCYTTHIPQALSKDESLWLIKNHPSCYKHFTNLEEVF